ncbi:MAG: hypothetical protein CM15mP18_3510 [Methanobacteriota archaeon]|nr:MAG: hypothetical protein CM15mP18_3510 [Euryarchaeota archaeon]
MAAAGPVASAKHRGNPFSLAIRGEAGTVVGPRSGQQRPARPPGGFMGWGVSSFPFFEGPLKNFRRPRAQFDGGFKRGAPDPSLCPIGVPPAGAPGLRWGRRLKAPGPGEGARRRGLCRHQFSPICCNGSACTAFGPAVPHTPGYEVWDRCGPRGGVGTPRRGRSVIPGPGTGAPESFGSRGIPSSAFPEGMGGGRPAGALSPAPMLHHLGHLSSEDSVLIHGGGGGVGTAAPAFPMGGRQTAFRGATAPGKKGRGIIRPFGGTPIDRHAGGFSLTSFERPGRVWGGPRAGPDGW